MAWKQDLAKLKQQLAPEPAAPAPRMPRPAPKPAAPAPMEAEDAVFMAAMGLRRAAAPVPSPAPGTVEPPQKPVEAPTKPPETFDEALRDLKGLKPLAKGLPGLVQTRPATPKAQAPLSPATGRPAPPPLGAPAPPSAESGPDPLPDFPVPPASLAASDLTVLTPEAGAAPSQFNLAAGMALEVDAVLDLRGHSLGDALGRLKDRLGDGCVLGWRVLQVTLGSDPLLHEGLLTLLSSGSLPAVARYARAPIPMGGNEAWLLYFAPPPPEPERPEATR